MCHYSVGNGRGACFDGLTVLGRSALGSVVVPTRHPWYQQRYMSRNGYRPCREKTLTAWDTSFTSACSIATSDGFVVSTLTMISDPHPSHFALRRVFTSGIPARAIALPLDTSARNAPMAPSCSHIRKCYVCPHAIGPASRRYRLRRVNGCRALLSPHGSQRRTPSLNGNTIGA